MFLLVFTLYKKTFTQEKIGFSFDSGKGINHEDDSKTNNMCLLGAGAQNLQLGGQSPSTTLSHIKTLQLLRNVACVCVCL